MAAARNDDYIIENIDRAISELVYDKWKLQKAYNYYNGKRDPEQFRYLEENFGIGNPTSVEFTPLIKKHIDALIGEYLDIPILPKVSCKDSATISKIQKDLQAEIDKQLYNYYQSKIQNANLQFQRGEQPQEDKGMEQQMQKIEDEINDNFISEYEIAAQNVIEYIIQSRQTDLKNKQQQMLLDLLTSGFAVFRVKPSPNGNNVVIEVCNPMNVFPDRNPESPYITDAYRIVHRKWMTKQQILNQYGKELTQDSRSELEDLYEHCAEYSYTYVRTSAGLHHHSLAEGDIKGVANGQVVVPGYPGDPGDLYNYKLLPVYEVEWIDVDKEGEDYVQNRYEGVRIGNSIYVTTGKSKNIIRTVSDPTHCTLSYGGLYILNRDNEPSSLVLQCANLQDKYDVVMYLRDNILANSGTAGDWLDVSMLPTFLGADTTERIQKWLAYKKTGMALMDSSQEGRGFNNNTFVAGYDDSVKAQVIQAFDLVLLRIEEQTSSITGVFRERLNGITQKDAVSNVEAGARNSFTITKPFYQKMDTLTVELLSGCLDMGKIVWKNGLQGTLILGDKLQKVFSVLPKYYTHTDFDVHIVASTQILKDLQDMKSIVIELIKSGIIEPDMAADALTCKSLTELKYTIRKAWAKKKEENNQIQQLTQQLEEAQKAVQQLQQQNQQLQKEVEKNNEAQLEIERERLKADTQIRWYEAQTNRDFKTNQAEVDKQKVQIELNQLYDGNPYNDQIRFTR